MSGSVASALLGVLLSAAVAAPGEPVQLPGAVLSPPGGFRRIEDPMVKGSAALVPLVAGEGVRALVASFAEGGEFGTATLSVGRVERPLELDPGIRSAVASAIAGHFRGELDLEVVVDRPVLVQGAHGPRLEARARTQAGGEARTVRFAFVPAGAVHYVLAGAFPADREADYEEQLTRAFESFAAETAPAPPASRDGFLRAAAFGLAGILLVAGLGLWQRHKRKRAE